MSTRSRLLLRRAAIVTRRTTLAVGAALLIASAAGGPSFATQLTAAIDLKGLLQARSPGSRNGAELTKVKRASQPAERTARVQPRVREKLDTAIQPTAAALTSAAAPESDPFIPALEPTFADPKFADSGAFNEPGPISVTRAALSDSIAGGSLAVGGIGIGGGLAPNFGTVLQPDLERTEPNLAAVPEPATWLMLMLGFGLLGWRVRRSQTVQTMQA